MKSIKALPWMRLAIVAVGVLLAIAVRLSLVDYKSSDYFAYSKGWYNTIKMYGFAAFGQNFYNYNPPYLYLLYAVIRFFPSLPGPIAVKLPSLLADFVSAWFVYRIVRLRYQGSALPLVAGFAALFAPTVVLNSAFWGQTDALYASALLATLYFLIQRNGIPGMLCFGLAVAFKAQGMFLAPVVLALLLRREIPWKHALLVPLVMAAALLPAFLAGRPLLDLLLIYPSQADQYQMLSMHAPSIYALLPDGSKTYAYFYPAGLVAASAVALAFVILVQQSRAKLTSTLVVELSLASVLLMPYFLPKMHERYFFSADLMAIVFAAFLPAYFYSAVAMTTISFLAYQPYLFGQEVIPMALLALVLLGLVALVSWRTIHDLYACETSPLEANAAPPPP